MTQNQREINRMIAGKLSADVNLDDYVDKMLAIQKTKNNKMEQQYLRQDPEWKKFVSENNEEVKKLTEGEWLDNLNAIKQINFEEKDNNPLNAKILDKVKNEVPVPELKFAEEELLEEIEKEREEQQVIEAEMRVHEEKERLERIKQVEVAMLDVSTSNFDTEFKLEMERMYM